MLGKALTQAPVLARILQAQEDGVQQRAALLPGSAMAVYRTDTDRLWLQQICSDLSLSVNVSLDFGKSRDRSLLTSRWSSGKQALRPHTRCNSESNGKIQKNGDKPQLFTEIGFLQGFHLRFPKGFMKMCQIQHGY